MSTSGERLVAEPRPEVTASGSFDSDDILLTLRESMTCDVVLVDGEGRIRLTNKRFEDALGIPSDGAVGRLGTDLVPCARDSAKGKRCSTAVPCFACRLWKLAGVALEQKEEQRISVRVEVEAQGTTHFVEVGIRAAALRIGEERLALLILQDFDRLCDFRRWAREGGMHGILGTDPKMFELFETLRRVAPIDVPILIQGESGTGKDLVAAALHRESRRKDGRMVPVNCGALSSSLLESELFGHVKGAFTGALRDKKGRFELADGGTIFLDEVGELGAEMQVKLLRVLQDGTFERVGGERTIRADARVISATNRDLGRAVASGKFRSDLFYRLCVVPVTVPPLRARIADIPLLVEHSLTQAATDFGREIPELSPALEELLLNHLWPGNVRELMNAMRHALIHSRGSRLEPEHLPKSIAEHTSRPMRAGRPRKLQEAAVRRALNAAEGNKLRAAHLLGVSRATLYRYLADESELHE